MILEKTVNDLIGEISSSSPTPGGGSVSALAGSLGTALAIMVTNLTLGKKKYEAVQEEISKLKNELENDIKLFYELYDMDSSAFDGVMAAFKLAKLTEDEIAKRSEAIEQATVKATEVPMRVIEHALTVSKKSARVGEIGNQNSVSDVGVAMSLLKTASDGAFLNVMINTKSMNNQEVARSLTLKSAKLIEEIDSIVQKSLNEIKKNLEL
ncbi:MAG: cyclodeaminase/cyclohydrolase family protein [Ignavibacteria bacterium]|nr:cyclodeaminase/cyclohydrolase family protein [Ignavibacteria bacterium]